MEFQKFQQLCYEDSWFVHDLRETLTNDHGYNLFHKSNLDICDLVYFNQNLHYLVPKPTPEGTLVLDSTMSGSVVASTGTAALVRIPIPNHADLYLEFKPRGRVPSGGSTSSIFIQDSVGKRQLRLDYGFNKKTGMWDYHWNQNGTYQSFGIENHTPIGRGGKAMHTSAKFFRLASKPIAVVGVAVDALSIVTAEKKIRQTAKVISGWGGLYLGCKAGGASGASLGGTFGPGGAIAGGVGGCIVIGAMGSFGFSHAAGVVYDTVEEVYFQPIPEISPPAASISQ